MSRKQRLPRTPPRIVELSGGLATGLEALLKVGYAISSYAWVDIDPDAHTATSHRIAHLRSQFPHLLPRETIKNSNSRLSLDVGTISTELLKDTFVEGINLVLANSFVPATHHSNPMR